MKNRKGTIRQLNYQPARHQWEFHQLAQSHLFTLALAGVRGGKTTAGAVEAGRQAWNNPYETIPYLVAAPTYRLLEDVTQKTFCEMNSAIIRDFYVSKRTAVLKNNRLVIFRGGDKPGRWKGLKLWGIWMDELAEFKELAFDIAQQRLLDMQSKGGGKFIGTTTPEGLNFVYDYWFEDPDEDFIYKRWKTTDNRYISRKFVEKLRNRYDPKFASQELDAQFVQFAGMCYGMFERSQNVYDLVGIERELRHRGKDVELHKDGKYFISENLNRQYQVSACVDFNINPMSAAIIQDIEGIPVVIDEIVLQTSNTDELAIEIKERFEQCTDVYPDPSGKSRSTAAGGKSDFDILEKHGFEVWAKSAAPKQIDRINAVNGLLCNSYGHRNLFVAKHCKNMIRSCQRTKYKDGTRKIDKTAGDEHITDALGYYVDYEHPITHFVDEIME